MRIKVSDIMHSSPRGFNLTRYVVYGEAFSPDMAQLWETHLPRDNVLAALIRLHPSNVTFEVPVSWMEDIGISTSNALNETGSNLLTVVDKLKPQVVASILKKGLSQADPNRIHRTEWRSPEYDSLASGCATEVWAADVSRGAASDKIGFSLVSDKGDLVTGEFNESTGGTAVAETKAVLQLIEHMGTDVALFLTDSLATIKVLQSSKHDALFAGKAVCVRWQRAHIQEGDLHVVANWAAKACHQL